MYNNNSEFIRLTVDTNSLIISSILRLILIILNDRIQQVCLYESRSPYTRAHSQVVFFYTRLCKE